MLSCLIELKGLSISIFISNILTEKYRQIWKNNKNNNSCFAYFSLHILATE